MNHLEICKPGYFQIINIPEILYPYVTILLPISKSFETGWPFHSAKATEPSFSKTSRLDKERWGNVGDDPRFIPALYVLRSITRRSADSGGLADSKISCQNKVEGL